MGNIIWFSPTAGFCPGKAAPTAAPAASADSPPRKIVPESRPYWAKSAMSRQKDGNAAGHESVDMGEVAVNGRLRLRVG